MKLRHALAYAILSLATMALFISARTARADVEFTTFGPGDSYNTSSSVVISAPGGVNPPGVRASADEFTASFNGMLSSVRVAVESDGVPYGSDGYLSLNLYSNDPLTNLPGSEVAMLGELTATNGVATLVTNAFVVPLVSGTSYWLAVEPFDAYTDADWYSADNANATESADSSNGVTYSAATGAEAFDINATPDLVPEPSIWTMLMGGLALLGLINCRRVRRA